jgi:hypothetical protein
MCSHSEDGGRNFSESLVIIFQDFRQHDHEYYNLSFFYIAFLKIQIAYRSMASQESETSAGVDAMLRQSLSLSAAGAFTG